MTALLRCLLVLPALWMLPAAAVVDEVPVEVKFQPYDQYLDIGDGMDARHAMREIENHLKRLGKSYLLPGQHLLIEVLEVDLAGRVEMVGDHLSPVRVLRGRVDAPRLSLRYTLQDGEKLLQRGEDSLTDLMYLDHVHGGFADQPLFYEKQLLDAWFKARFAVPPSKESKTKPADR